MKNEEKNKEGLNFDPKLFLKQSKIVFFINLHQNYVQSQAKNVLGSILLAYFVVTHF